jgi:hypothetical protein
MAILRSILEYRWQITGTVNSCDGIYNRFESVRLNCGTESVLVFGIDVDWNSFTPLSFVSHRVRSGSSASWDEEQNLIG